jgi:hypothetical protein
VLDLFLPIVLAFSDPDSSPRARDLCQKVMDLQPAADPRWACAFADRLDRYATRHDMDPYLSLAIAMQESSLQPDAIGPTGDLGVFQFHPATMRSHGIERAKLDRGGSYSVEQHLLLLKSKMAMCRDRMGWSCYHSVTPSLRRTYEARVLRYYHRR